MNLLFLILALPLISVSRFDVPPNKKNLTPCFVNISWKLEEIRFQQDNVAYYYKNGDYSRTNIRFDDDSIIFLADGTGTYHQSDDAEYPITWKAENDGQLIFKIQKFRFNKDLVVTWEHINCNGTNISYTEYYTHANGVHSLGYGMRVNNACTQDVVRQ
jgi:hypothetical protein